MSTPSLEVHVRRVPSSPVVAARAWLRHGARNEATAGQALVTGRLLTEGTSRRSFSVLGREAEERGMVIESFGSYESIGVSIDALSRDTHRVLDDLAELVLDPAFPPARFDLIRRRAGAELESQLDQPEVRTARAFLGALYGAHPYGRPLAGSPEALGRLDVDACRSFHRRALASGVVVAVTGDIEESMVRDAVSERFADPVHASERRPAQVPAQVPEEPQAPPPVRAARLVIDLPPGDQAHVLCGHLSVTRADPDRPALDLLGVVLGAGPGVRGRIPDRVREREGLAYGLEVGVAAGAGHDRGRFQVYAGTAPEHVEALERAIREELDSMLDSGPTAAEVEEAKSYLVGSLPFTVETPRLVADRLAESAFYGPGVEPDALDRAWRALTRHDVHEAAKRHLDPGAMTVTIGIPGTR